MAVKVLMKRVPTSGNWHELNEVLRELRMLAMTQPGYLSGETLLSASSQGTTMVISTWESVKHWTDYEASSERSTVLAKLAPVIAEPAVTEVWVESPVIG